MKTLLHPPGEELEDTPANEELLDIIDDPDEDNGPVWMDW